MNKSNVVLALLVLSAVFLFGCTQSPPTDGSSLSDSDPLVVEAQNSADSFSDADAAALEQELLDSVQ
ncbi:MAG: hypothetical protein V1847_00815 [Candidatus Diapherotrites archaeon]